MLTFFTTAKPFTGHNGMIQRSAPKSWKLLRPDVEVVVFGDERLAIGRPRSRDRESSATETACAEGKLPQLIVAIESE